MLLLYGFRSSGGEVSTAVHLAKPESLFYFRDVHFIRQEIKKKNNKNLPLRQSWRKGPLSGRNRQMLWRATACGQLVCSQILLSKSYPKSAACPDIRALSSVCLLWGDVCRCFVFPKSARVIGGNKCPTRLVMKFCGAATYFLSVNRSAAVLFVFSVFWGKGKIRLHLS